MRPIQSGITLLELVLVIALISIVAAIAVPTYTSTVDRARSTQAIADIGGLSLKLYNWQARKNRFPATLAEAGLAMDDPWGRPYLYVNVGTAPLGSVRKDKNLVPINTDFDLYSSGPDARTVPPLTAKVSRDDVVRANDGGFIGIAKDY